MAENKKPVWTASQKEAIELRGKNLLVSAAAGSGKTATLTERIIRSLTNTENPADISKMLVVTFTRAAASELRMKISRALAQAISENPANASLSEQLIKLGDAKICTIDSFYYDILRENAMRAGLPQSFRIGDEAQLAILARETMNDVLDDRYSKEPESTSALAECFASAKTMRALPDIFINIHSRLSAFPEGLEFLPISAARLLDNSKKDFFTTDMGKVLLEDIDSLLEYLISVLKNDTGEILIFDELAEKYYPSFAYNLEFCLSLREKLSEHCYASSREAVLQYSPIPPKRVSSATDVSRKFLDKNKKCEEKIRQIAHKFFALTPDELERAMTESAQVINILHSLLSDFDTRFISEKIERGVLGFDDIRRYVFKLLVSADGTPTELASSLSEQFTDIYIDEYQDVDRVQDRIFAAISNGKNRFMVGDIKQSIYGFRGAEPSVFASYRQSFPAHSKENTSDSAKIFMSENFRCDENVVKFTNLVCSHLFGICAESIGYTHEDDLKFSKKPPHCDYTSPKVKISLIAPPDKVSFPDFDRSTKNLRSHEAKHIAREVKRLLAEEKKADGTPLLPCDIAVIFRTKAMLQPLKEAFEEAGLDYTGGEDAKYFENPDVLLMLSLLNTIDNPSRDIHLAAVLRSPLFDITLDELITLRRYCDASYSLYEALSLYCERESGSLCDKCQAFLSELEYWRDMTLTLPVDKLLQRIYASARFCSAGLADSENLTVLYEYARRFEAGSFRGLYNFIGYINKLISQGDTIENRSEEVSRTKVVFLTAHHSKGLEFPVCFVCGTASPFNSQDTRNSAVWDASLGFAIKLSDPSGFARLNTPMREAIISKMQRDAAEEEIRVLYVALTRARERLYISAITTSGEAKLIGDAMERKGHSGKYLLNTARSEIEWILEAIASEDTKDICELSYYIIDPDAKEAPDEKLICAPEDAPINSALFEKLRADFAYSYPYISRSRLPSKLSVSRLSPDVLDDADTALSLFEDAPECEIPEILLSDNDERASAAQRGTATHQFLQFCDFSRAKRTGAREELERLIAEEFLPSSARYLVYVDELEGFFESDLYEKISKAQRIVREQRFNILLPPSMFSRDLDFCEDTDGELLAVQGVIDLVIIDEEGKLCLYDYKTDRLTESERKCDALLSAKLHGRHSQQLSYYKIAVERLFGKTCETVGIYSTHAQKTV